MKTYIILGAVIAAIALLVFAIVHIYNKLIKARNRVNTQWAQIDVQLTRRTDVIPNLVNVVKGYVSYEKEIFEKLAAARSALESADSPGHAIKANDGLSAQLQRVLAVAEAYPDLKADKCFIELQVNLKDTEDKITYARQFYNDTVLIYKDILHTFPSNIIAKLFHFKDEAYYIAEDEKKDVVKISM